MQNKNGSGDLPAIGCAFRRWQAGVFPKHPADDGAGAIGQDRKVSSYEWRVARKNKKPETRNTKCAAILVLLILGLLSGCLSQTRVSKQSTKLEVVTTVSPITNIVKNIGGDKINLYGIIPGGMDSHTFEPRPSDAKHLAKADLIIINGLHLETPTLRLAEANKKPEAVILKLGEETINHNQWIFDFSFPREKGDPNPHLWLNVAYAINYAKLVKEELIRLDPPNKANYESNAQRYLALLEDLDKNIAASVKTIPAKNRKLLTYHDSWAYFAKRYGMRTIGAIQPADFAEPSPQEVAAMIEQIKAERLPAIFGSEVYPSKVIEQIGKEAKVKYISTLRDDGLPGKRIDPYHTYVGMMLENMRQMIVPLGGDIKALKGINPGNTYIDDGGA